MSLEAVQAIIGRAIRDTEFRDQMMRNPDPLLDARDVTTEEKEALKNMDWGAIEAFGRDLEQRVSRMGMALDEAKCS